MLDDEHISAFIVVSFDTTSSDIQKWADIPICRCLSPDSRLRASAVGISFLLSAVCFAESSSGGPESAGPNDWLCTIKVDWL